MKTAPAKDRKHNYQLQLEPSIMKTTRQMYAEGLFPLCNYLQRCNLRII